MIVKGRRPNQRLKLYEEGCVSIDELSGRALDAAIAHDVFGLEVEERANARTGERDWVCRKLARDWNRVAFYGSLGASIKLEVKLAELGWKVKPWPFGRNPAPSGSVLVALVNGKQQVDASGHTFEEALCRAAVAAVAPNGTSPL
jgi:hypothetical protein